ERRRAAQDVDVSVTEPTLRFRGRERVELGRVLASNHPDLAHAVIAISDVCARIEALCVLNLFQCPLAAVGRTDTRDRVRRKHSAVVTTELLQHTGGNNLPFVRSKRVENTATVSRRWLVHVRKQERTPRARHVATEHLAQER